MQNNTKAGAVQQLNWLSIVREITITLVVMYHVRMQDFSTHQNYTFISDIYNLFNTMRMPTFIFVSGALLYYTRIAKGWGIGRLYLDKIVRVGVPLLFCTIIGCLSQIVFNGFVKHPHPVTVQTFLLSLVTCDEMPWPHRWYMMELLVLMSLYPIYSLAIQKQWRAALFGLLVVVLYIFDFTAPVSHNWFYIFTVNKYLPYFYLGVVAFHYQWWQYLRNYKVALVVVLLHIGMFFVPYELDLLLLLHQFLGIATMVTIGLWLDRIVPQLCSAWRKYVFQIYMFGIAFQAFVELILWPRFGTPNMIVPFYLLNIISGILFPVLICKVVERIPIQWVRLCFGLK